MPPLWAGCDLSAWARLLGRNHFAVERSRWRVAAVATAVSVAQSVLGITQRLTHGNRVARTPITLAPLFILGHWRSGTTLLHELLALDPRHAAPTTFDCFNPHHFLLTRSWLPQLLARFLPDRRPADNIAVGWNRPQEDEFALCLLGLPSPYERIAFPNRPAAGDAALDLTGLSPRAHRDWEQAFLRFVRTLSYANAGRRLILKSPPHTARVPTLLKLFPNARFIHVVRDPFVVYASTLHLWRTLYATEALQVPSWEGLPEYILRTFERMHRAFSSAKRLIPASRLHELRYEELVRDPLDQLRTAYTALGLGDFEPVRPHIDAYLASRKGYETGTYMLTAEERRAIKEQWGEFIREYGYET